MSLLNKLTSHPKIFLATVAISSVTLGFAAGLGIGKQTATTSSQNQSSLAEAEAPPQGKIPPGQNGALTSGQNTGKQMQPAPGQGGGNRSQLPPGTDATSGASQSTNGDMQPPTKNPQDTEANQGTDSSISSDSQ